MYNFIWNSKWPLLWLKKDIQVSFGAHCQCTLSVHRTNALHSVYGVCKFIWSQFEDQWSTYNFIWNSKRLLLSLKKISLASVFTSGAHFRRTEKNASHSDYGVCKSLWERLQPQLLCSNVFRLFNFNTLFTLFTLLTLFTLFRPIRP